MFEDEKKEQRRQIAKEIEQRNQLNADIRDTFSTANGRRVLKWLLEGMFANEDVFTGNSKTYYNAALDALGKRLKDKIAEADPETYLWLHAQRVNEVQAHLNQFYGRAYDSAEE